MNDTVVMRSTQEPESHEVGSWQDADAEELLEALAKRPTDQNLLTEVTRRLKSNQATRLAVRYLLGSGENREDAFDGLVGLCWKAKGNLYVGPTYGERRLGRRILDCTREFIQEFVLDYFRPYDGLDVIEILEAALNEKFRFIGHRSQGRMIDEIRRRTAAKNVEPEREPLENFDLLPSQTAGKVENLPNGGRDERRAYLSFLEPRKEKLTERLGETSYEVLLSHLDVFPEAYEGNDQSLESAITEAIQKRRQVSPQQARTDKRRFRETVNAEIRTNNQELLDFRVRLSIGDDDHTLRNEWITGRGRKSSTRFRILLSNS